MIIIWNGVTAQLNSRENAMIKRGLCYIFMSILLLTALGDSAFSLSVTAKSEKDYYFLMHHLRDLQIIIGNFADDTQKKKYESISDEFRTASMDYYAHNFVFFDKNSKRHRMKFYLVKIKLSELLDEMAKSYIDRSSELLRTTSKDSFNILIKFNKGGYAKYFTRPIDPVSTIKEEKIYKAEEYHLYSSMKTIEEYLKKGYKALDDAKKIYNHPDMEIVKAKTEKNNYDVNYMVTSFINIITMCRQAKQYGIEIYRLIRRNNIYAVEKQYEKYNIPLTTPEPIFDVRIPEDYKIDANDNIKLLHSHELKRLPADFPKSPSISQISPISN